MRLEDLDFDLPPRLVAQQPAEARDAARLLVLDRRSGESHHRVFRDLLALLHPEDVLVLNETRVVPARLRGRKVRTGGRVEVLLLRREATGTWLAIGRPLRGLVPGDAIDLERGGQTLEVVARIGDRVRLRVPAAAGEPVADGSDPTGLAGLLPLAQEAGEVPLPPYIRRAVTPADAERYQTVYARDPGSIAAPTAGLHFTPQLLDAMRARGVGVVSVVLHVGPGTFEPIRSDDPRQHRLEAEYYRLSGGAVAEIDRRRRAGGRAIAVGTTTVRTLETCARDGVLRAGEGWTDLLIHPPYEFRAVDALLTNFHLPRSSLLMLVAAFAGRERLLSAYDVAVREGYRFYSYGDAMFVC